MASAYDFYLYNFNITKSFGEIICPCQVRLKSSELIKVFIQY